MLEKYKNIKNIYKNKKYIKNINIKYKMDTCIFVCFSLCPGVRTGMPGVGPTNIECVLFVKSMQILSFTRRSSPTPVLTLAFLLLPRGRAGKPNLASCVFSQYRQGWNLGTSLSFPSASYWFCQQWTAYWRQESHGPGASRPQVPCQSDGPRVLEPEGSMNHVLTHF